MRGVLLRMGFVQLTFRRSALGDIHHRTDRVDVARAIPEGKGHDVYGTPRNPDQCTPSASSGLLPRQCYSFSIGNGGKARIWIHK